MHLLWWSVMQSQAEELNQEDSDRVAEKVFAAQVKYLYSQLPVTVIGSLAIVSCIAYMLFGTVSSTVLIIWYSVFVVVTLVRGWQLMRYQYAEDKDYQHWANTHIVSAFLGGCLIGAVPIIATNAPLEIQSFVLFVIAGLCAGGLSTHASLLKAFIGFLVPITMIPGIWFLCQSDQYHMVSGVVLVLFALLMVRSCRNYAGMLENALQLQFSNEMLNAHLEEARVSAEAAYDAKSMFLSSMSHELRTPMNAVLGFAQLIEDDEENALNEEQNEYINQIKKAGWHLLDLINSILDLAKLEADKVEVFPTVVRIGDVVNECVMIVSPIAKKSGITIDDNASRCDIEVVVDCMRMKQVILNLLSNGIKYNREGGRLTLEPPEVRDDVCYLAVTDTGVGLAQQQMVDVFLPFNRVVEHDSKIEGTGIGLNITCNLLELMGGRIGVESEKGVGSTFWIEVPLAEQSKR